MTFNKSIPERPHGGTPPSWASTSLAAPPARSDPSRRSYQIATLKQEQPRLTAEHDQLLAKLAGERAANRVATAAVQLGLSHPSRWQYVHSAQSPIALGPRPANQGRSGVWDGVLAVLAAVIGRPLNSEATH